MQPVPLGGAVSAILGVAAMPGQLVVARRLTQAPHGRQINHARAGLIEVDMGVRQAESDVDGPPPPKHEESKMPAMMLDMTRTAARISSTWLIASICALAAPAHSQQNAPAAVPVGTVIAEKQPISKALDFVASMRSTASTSGRA